MPLMASTDCVEPVACTIEIPGRATLQIEHLLLDLNATGAQRCAAIGNRTNDVAMLSAAALGIAVIGPEGASTAALAAADVVCRSILDALDLLLDDRVIVATLRA